jgi:hypothetical protein
MAPRGLAIFQSRNLVFQNLYYLLGKLLGLEMLSWRDLLLRQELSLDALSLLKLLEFNTQHCLERFTASK